jgi:hypothetical protein
MISPYRNFTIIGPQNRNYELLTEKHRSNVREKKWTKAYDMNWEMNRQKKGMSTFHASLGVLAYYLNHGSSSYASALAGPLGLAAQVQPLWISCVCTSMWPREETDYVQACSRARVHLCASARRGNHGVCAFAFLQGHERVEQQRELERRIREMDFFPPRRRYLPCDTRHREKISNWTPGLHGYASFYSCFLFLMYSLIFLIKTKN